MQSFVLRSMFMLLALVLSCTFVQGQEQENLTGKGRILLATSTGLSLAGVKIEDIDDQIFILDTEINGGYFFFDNLAFGLVAGYEYTKFGDLEDWSFNLGVFGRYYTPPKIFLGTGYLISQSKDGDVVGTLPVELGYALFINRTFTFEPAFSLGIGTSNNDTFIYSLNLGFGVYLN